MAATLEDTIDGISFDYDDEYYQNISIPSTAPSDRYRYQPRVSTHGYDPDSDDCA